MSSLIKDLQTIRKKKEAQLKELERTGNDHLIDYPILSEEIEDVIYTIESLSIDDETERMKNLTTVFNSSTSGSLYDTFHKYFKIEKAENDWVVKEKDTGKDEQK